MINKYKQELSELLQKKQIIDKQKKELWKKIANLKNKIAVYKIRGKLWQKN